jgi:hypothetical protein
MIIGTYHSSRDSETAAVRAVSFPHGPCRWKGSNPVKYSICLVMSTSLTMLNQPLELT